MSNDIVPLPPDLELCGCPQAKHGRHLISCQPARDYDSVPLTDRPEYEPGRRFRAISWQYPLEFTTKINVTVNVDPVEFIATHLDEYDEYDERDFDYPFEAWEKPIVFMAEKVMEECDGGMFGFGVGRYVAAIETFTDDPEEYPRWKPDDTARLDEALAAKRAAQ